MANITLIKETDGNIVNTKTGRTVYPATTVNAVYDTSTRTLKQLIDNPYNPENENIKENGIYQWLDNLTNRFIEYTKTSDFNILTNKLINIQSDINKNLNDTKVLDSLIKSVSSRFTDEISRVEGKIYAPEFDNVPTKGSTKLLNSGALYSYLSKIISKNILDIEVVEKMDDYNAENGDIVMYGGQNTDDYQFGSLYMAKVEYVRNPDSICHERIKNTTWTLLGSILGNGNIDLSNYYNKSEVDALIGNIHIPNNKYYAGKNINIDENNFISAIVPETDLSAYYNREEVDDIVSRINRKNNVYTAGDNISIDGNVISANVPDIDNLVTQQDLKDAINGINTNRYIAGDHIRINGNTISALIDVDSTLSDDSENPISNKTVSKSLAKKVDASRVANVAFTGSYNDLKDIPIGNSVSVVPGSDNVKVEEIETNTEKAFRISVDSANVPVADVKVNGTSVIENKVANISIPAVEVENKKAYLMFGERTTVASINGTDVSVLMPDEPETSVINNNPTLEFGKQSTIGTVNDTELTLVMPQKPKAVVENKNAVLSYGEESLIAKVDGVDIKVSMPDSIVVPGVSVVNNNASLNYGETATVGSVNGTELTITMPSKPETEEVSVVNKNATLVYGGTTTLASVNGTDINVTMPDKPQQSTVSVNNNNPTLNYGQTATLGSVNGTNLTLKMPDAVEAPLTDVKVNGNSVVENKVANITIDEVEVIDYETPSAFGEKTTLAKVGGTDITITLPSEQSVSVTDYAGTLSWGTKNTIANVAGKDITVTMPSAPSSGGTVTVSNKSATLEQGETVTLATVGTTNITAKLPYIINSSNYYTKTEINNKIPTNSEDVQSNNLMTYQKYGNLCIVQLTGVMSSYLENLEVKSDYRPSNNNIAKTVCATCMSSLLSDAVPVSVEIMFNTSLNKWIFHISNPTSSAISLWGQIVYLCN